MRGVALALVLAAACGRIDFDDDARPSCAESAPGEPCVSMMLESATWPQAKAACESMDPPAHLATINDRAENAEAAALAARIPITASQTSTNQRQRMWLGGNSLAAVGVWEWTDGEPFDYSNWRVGQPGSPATERCMILLGSQGGLWDDRPCDFSYEAFLCERE